MNWIRMRLGAFNVYACIDSVTEVLTWPQLDYIKVPYQRVQPYKDAVLYMQLKQSPRPWV